MDEKRRGPRKITKLQVGTLRKTAIRKDRPQYVWDTDLKGFGVKASPSGRVSWLVQKWTGGSDGKAQRVVIGHCPPMEIDEARKEAGGWIGDVHKGINIVERRHQDRQRQREAVHAPTLKETVELFLKRKAKPGRYWEEVTATLHRELVTPLGTNTLVSKITKQELRALIEAKQDSGAHGAARTLFAALRPFFKWCVERDIIAKSPLADITPPEPTQARDRRLTKAEIKALWQATEAMGLPFGPFYRLLLLTGQRRDEVSGMRHDELDFFERTWTIPKERTKNNKEHVVHLSEQALAVLAGIPRMDGSLFVFTTTGGTPISGYSRAKEKLDSLMQSHLEDKKLKPWRVHDLRRTITSTLAELGFPTDVADRLLNHISGSQSGVKGVYQRYEFLPERKRAIEAWGNYVERLVSEKPSTENVVQLRG